MRKNGTSRVCLLLHSYISAYFEYLEWYLLYQLFLILALWPLLTAESWLLVW
jgi:hypothetical protein